jgi:hypothetical protein
MESDRGRHPLLDVLVLDAGAGYGRVWQLHATVLALGVGGLVVALTTGVSPRPISLRALALFSVALGWTGWGLVRTVDA